MLGSRLGDPKAYPIEISTSSLPFFWNHYFLSTFLLKSLLAYWNSTFSFCFHHIICTNFAESNHASLKPDILGTRKFQSNSQAQHFTQCSLHLLPPIRLHENCEEKRRIACQAALRRDSAAHNERLAFPTPRAHIYFENIWKRSDFQLLWNFQPSSYLLITRDLWLLYLLKLT